MNLVREFAEPAAVVIKHNNPCGAAVAGTLEEAFRKAYEGDPLSAFGGVLGFNREVDEATATQITEPNRFIECIIAPGLQRGRVRAADDAADLEEERAPAAHRAAATGRRAAAVARFPPRRWRPAGADARPAEADDFADVQGGRRSGRRPTAELADLRFAWLVCKHVKSNAIVLAKGGMVVGVGAGQMSRVDSVHIAVRKAGDRVPGSVLASDAFFPFRDNVDEAARAGVTAIVQPGGSMRDAGLDRRPATSTAWRWSSPACGTSGIDPPPRGKSP